MSKQPWTLQAVALVISLSSLPACGLEPVDRASGFLLSQEATHGPTIREVTSTAVAIDGRDEEVTFAAVASDPGDRPLVFTWTTTKGTLLARTGNPVIWRPHTAGGQIEPGLATIKVVVTNGRQSTSALVKMYVTAAGRPVVEQVEVATARPPIVTTTPPASAAPSITMTKMATPSPTAVRIPLAVQVPATPAPPVNSARNAGTPLASLPTGHAFEGAWFTEWGPVKLHVDGNTVKGDMPYLHGTLDATLAPDGKSLEGVWHKTAPDPNGIQEGRVRFTLLADGRTLKGEHSWGQGAHQAPWNGSRVDPALVGLIDPAGESEGKDFQGDWSTEKGLLRISLQGSRVVGSYPSLGGKLDGMLQPNGKRLSGQFCQGPSHHDPVDTGDVEFEISLDGKRLTGHFSTLAGESGAWNATRL